MRKTLMTVVLMLALCCPAAFAGEMNTPPVAPGQQPNSMQELNIDGDTAATDGLMQAVLDVIFSVLP
jgi:hypothetical protein